MGEHEQPGGERSIWFEVAQRLVAHGVEHVFGLPGDDMAALAAFSRWGIAAHLAADQRHAVYQAVAYARLSGSVGVCFVGKGPAVTHASTGVLEAQAMRTPLVLLTSGVPAAQLGTGAFQELDAVEVLRPLSKWVRRVSGPGSLAHDLDEAVLQATTGSPGAACLEIAEGMLGAEPALDPGSPPPGSPPPGSPPTVASVVDGAALFAAERPLFLVGGGSRGPGVGALVVELAERLGAGIVCTASGRGVVDESCPLFLGLSGLYARPPVADVVAGADLVVALGSRLEETATYGWPEEPPAIVQVNISAADVAPGWAGPTVVGEVAAVLRAWLSDAPPVPVAGGARGAWRAMVESARTDLLALAATGPRVALTAPARVADVLATLDEVLPPARVSVHENGLQDMWSYFFPVWTVGGESDCLVPSEQTPLGFGFGCAPGAALAAGGRPVVVIGGDGAFTAALSDLATLAEVAHPVLLVVLANGGFGWLESNLRGMASEGSSAQLSFLRPRRPLAALSAAYGIDHVACRHQGELLDAVAAAWAQCATGRPVVLEVEVALADVPPGMEHLAGDFPLSSAPVEVAG